LEHRATAETAADERAELLRVRAAHLAATGRCDEALGLVGGRAERDAETERLIGRCAVQAQRYATALEALDRARSLDSGLAGVELYRGISLYHLEDYDAAREALADARVEGEEVALLEFYRGLLFLRDDRPRESALAFERAAARSPRLVEPVASYYAALAWQSLNENEPLDSAVERVREEDPEGPWAEEAERLVELQAQRYRAGQTGLQRWFGARVGQEYDDNVTQLGGDGVFDTTFGDPEEFDFEEDWRTVWSARLGAELYEVEAWTIGAQADYSGNAHEDLDEFDQHYVTGMIWVDREFGATTFVRGMVLGGAAWFDGDSYLHHLTLGALVEERWGRPGITRCAVDTQLNDFRYDADLGGDEISDDFDDQYGDDFDQDGVELRIGCEHEYPLTVLRGFEPDLYGGYRFSNYFSQGDEWDHMAHRVHLGVRVMFPFDIELDARGTYMHSDYRNASLLYQPATGAPDRNDDAFTADVDLAKDITDHLVLSAHYQYHDSGSNTERFDYKRHIVGMYLELEWP